ncbi:MAG: ABC transporter substrate-binding protein [Candidatus Rokuibacteriota bacterium]
MERQSSPGLSRRRLLKIATGSAFALPIAACFQPQQGAAPTPTAGATAGATAAPTSSPRGPVTIRWVDAQAGPANYNRSWYERYQEMHPNVKIEYTLVPVAEASRTIQLFLQSDTPPDVFADTGVPAVSLIANKVVQPIEPYVTKEWKDTFPPETWLEGGMVFEGQAYSFPHSGTRQSEGVLFYNKDVFRKAGLDPEKPPATWAELREYSRQITEAGKGQFYGMIYSGRLPQQVGQFATVMATSSGSAFGPIGGGRATTGGIDWTTGDYAYSRDLYAEAVELLRQLDQDGSVFPGWASLSPQDAMARMAQGVAGMFAWGSYVVGQLRTGNYPEFDYGFAPPPTKGSQRFHLNTDPALPGLYLNAQSKAPDVVGELIMFRSSPEYFKGYVEQVGVQPSPLPDVDAAANVQPQFAGALKFFNDWVRYQPMPTIRNTQQTQVALEMKQVQPNFAGRILAGVAGEADIRASLRQYDQLLTAERARAIEAVKAKGADVSTDDWVFRNWTRSKDYGDADYSEA